MTVVTTSCCDGGNVHLQKFRRVSGTVVLLRQVRAELGRPCHCTEVLRQRSAAYPSHRGAQLYPGVHRRLGCHHVQVGIEVAALNVETALSRPLHGDAGVLTRAPAVELRPQVFCSCTPHYGGSARTPTRRPGAGGRVPPHCQAEVVAQSLQNWGRPEPDGGDGQRRPATASGRLARLQQPEGCEATP